MKGCMPWQKDIKKRRERRGSCPNNEEVVGNQPSSTRLEEARKRVPAEIWKQVPSFCAEMQNVQRRANETSTITKYHVRFWQKRSYHLDLRRALAIKLTDDVKKELGNGPRKLVHALKEEGIEEIQRTGPLTITTWPSNLTIRWWTHPADTIAESLRLTNSMTAS